MTDPGKLTQNREECNVTSLDHENGTYNVSQYTAISTHTPYLTTTYSNATFSTSNIGYYVYEYREEEEDTGKDKTFKTLKHFWPILG